MDTEDDAKILGFRLAHFITAFGDADEQARISLAVLREIGALQLEAGQEMGIDPTDLSEAVKRSLDDIAEHAAHGLLIIQAQRGADRETLQ